MVAGMLKIVHPAQYQAGISIIQRMIDSPDLLSKPDVMLPLLQHWGLPFTALSVIVNRLTPAHLDDGNRRNWFDICLSLGNYKNCWFRLPDLQIALFYPPGTAVVILAAMIRHEVPQFTGERVVFVLLSKESVHRALQTDPGNFAPLA